MTVGFLIAGVLAILAAAGALVVVLLAPRFGMVVRVAAGLPFAGLAAFSLFGFLASREPGNSVIWSVLYLALFLSCIIAIGRLVVAARAQPG